MALLGHLLELGALYSGHIVSLKIRSQEQS